MNGYEKLKLLIAEIDTLISYGYTVSSHEFIAWKNKCLIFLSNRFGEDSIEYRTFAKIRYSPAITYGDSCHNQFVEECRKGLKAAKAILEDMLTDMKSNSTYKMVMDKNSVFIVHGHNGELKYKISNMLRKVGLTPIILHEQANTSRTIIEKIEKYGCEAGAAIVLFTPDDVGKANSEEELKARGRQNVVFEAGYFMGLLGRDKVVLIKSDDSVELPGDLGGIVYSGTSELGIARELKQMGFDIDMNKL